MKFRPCYGEIVMRRVSGGADYKQRRDKKSHLMVTFSHYVSYSGV